MNQTEAPIIVFQSFTPGHLEKAVELSKDVSWPHRLEDWALTLSVSSGVVAMEGNEIVGTALCSNFGDVATINMIIVDARMRGRGLGRKLMDEALAKAGAREQRLVATADGLPLYKKLGFTPTGEIVQYQGTAKAVLPNQAVEVLEQPDIAELAAMDKAASGMDRVELFSKIAQNGTALRTEGGFAMLRLFGRGYVVGPIVAQDFLAAKSLMSAAATQVAGKFLRIDMPEALAPVDHAEKLGLTHAGGGIAMVRNPLQSTAADYKTFALVSQALS